MFVAIVATMATVVGTCSLIDALSAIVDDHKKGGDRLASFIGHSFVVVTCVLAIVLLVS